jgi:tetratricopeptide (TPR) repeat protein
VAATQITSRSGALDWYRAEQQVLPQVLAWAAGLKLDSDVVQLRMCMEGYGPISDLHATNQAMLAAALRLGDHTFIGTAYFAYGREALQRGSWDEATGHFANTLEHATLASDLNLQALAHGGLAYTADELDHVSDAIEHAQRAVALAQETGVREGEHLRSLGYYEVRAGNTEQGLAECRRAVELLRAADIASDLTVGLQLLGMSCQIAGRPAEAIAHLREAIALARESDYMEPRCLMWLGDALAATGDADAARDAWQHALNLYSQLAPSHPDVDKIRAKLKQAGS